MTGHPGIGRLTTIDNTGDAMYLVGNRHCSTTEALEEHALTGEPILNADGTELTQDQHDELEKHYSLHG